MALLALGMLLYAALHLIKSLAPSLRARLYDRLGEGGYKGLFSLLVLASFALIIVGWRSAVPQFVYLPPAGLHSVAMALLLLAFLLMVVSGRPSRLRQIVRHPQLTGVALWGIAHLMLNGNNRDLLLFGGMAVWAVVEIIAINRREGVWVKAEVPPLSTDLVNVVVAVAMVALVVYIHPWLAGVPVITR